MYFFPWQLIHYKVLMNFKYIMKGARGIEAISARCYPGKCSASHCREGGFECKQRRKAYPPVLNLAGHLEREEMAKNAT